MEWELSVYAKTGVRGIVRGGKRLLSDMNTLYALKLPVVSFRSSEFPILLESRKCGE